MLDRFKAMQERCDAADIGKHSYYPMPEYKKWRKAVDALIHNSPKDLPDVLWSLGVAMEALNYYAGQKEPMGYLARKARTLIERGRDAS